MKSIPIYLLAIMLFAGSGIAAKSKVVEKKHSTLQKLAKISPDSAKALALQKASGKITESGLEVENGVLFYSYDIQTKGGKITEVQINAKDGSIIPPKGETSAKEKAGKKGENAKMGTGEVKEGKEGKESEEKVEESAEKSEWVGSIPVKGDSDLAALAKINTEQADSAAVNPGGGTVRKTELVNEDGYLVYKVTVDFNGKSYEALVDAGTAKVLEIEPEG